MEDNETTLCERRAETTAPPEIEPSEVFVFHYDKGGKLVFYSDRSLLWTGRESRGGSFGDITAVDVFREPTRRAKLLGRGMIAFGLLWMICWTVWAVWQAFDLLIVVVGWVVGGVVALVGRVKSAEIWHVRVWNSSGESLCVISCAADITYLAQEAHDALFKGQEKDANGALASDSPMICTTLAAIGPHYLSESSWRKLLAHLGKRRADDECLPFHAIALACGLDDALSATVKAPQYRAVWRLYAVWCARRVQHLMTDPRCIAALDTAEGYAKGGATRNELNAAWNAACAASANARDGARDAEGHAARAAALTAAPGRGFACAGTVAAAAASTVASSVAKEGSAEWHAAWHVERDAQTAEFLRVVGKEELKEQREALAKQRS